MTRAAQGTEIGRRTRSSHLNLATIGTGAPRERRYEIRKPIIERENRETAGWCSLAFFPWADVSNHNEGGQGPWWRELAGLRLLACRTSKA